MACAPTLCERIGWDWCPTFSTANTACGGEEDCWIRCDFAESSTHQSTVGHIGNYFRLRRSDHLAAVVCMAALRPLVLSSSRPSFTLLLNLRKLPFAWSGKMPDLRGNGIADFARLSWESFRHSVNEFQSQRAFLLADEPALIPVPSPAVQPIYADPECIK